IEDVLKRLDQAIAARLLARTGDGRFGFIHDLVRETLMAALDTGERRRRHAAVVYALERSPRLATGMLPAQVAQHAYLAVPELEPSAAIDYVLTAAREASVRLA